MNFEEKFKSWTLDQKVEWALGPNICNLSNQMRSIIVDLKAENERLKAENEKLRCLALHGMFGYACWRILALANNDNKELARKKICQWNRLVRSWFLFYRMAKKELKKEK